ncbi:hypothetical protein EDB81DRAFT_756136 [Dactylonectria macrodidyma]|uniref:Uncharacterized protein n=1 Tax=Dactylonectria macrodidyma TaxID=307937 RepID=A0A9P9JJZ2_9HYPO|nr:hypothetical protein EDB81DRAFT_756136 [Dactylonectria macrodidyma]
MITHSSIFIFGLLATATWATPTPVSESISASRTSDLTSIASESAGCGAAGSCIGPGGGALCHDRVGYTSFTLSVPFRANSVPWRCSVSIVPDLRGCILEDRAVAGDGRRVAATILRTAVDL